MAVSLVESDVSHDATMALWQLAHDKPAVRKRATACLSSLAVVLSDALLKDVQSNSLRWQRTMANSTL